jgi:hypothetical protein
MLNLLPWQQEVFEDRARFKIVAAGRRTGKSRLAAWQLIIYGLQTNRGHVFYVAPTQGQARDIMWSTLLELAHPVIKTSHINNLQITLINGCTISLKGADRPETMRGVSLKFLVMDEYADMKPSVWEQILRPALADQKGDAMFIGTPMGRNHFYDLYHYATLGDDESYKAWHFTSYDNPLLDPDEIDTAKKSMSSYAFRQEVLWHRLKQVALKSSKKLDYSLMMKSLSLVIIILQLTLQALLMLSPRRSPRVRKLDQTAIAVVKANENGWWVADIIHGRWDIKKTAKKIFDAVDHYRPVAVGIEKGALKNAVLPYLTDIMKSGQRFFRVEELDSWQQEKD